MKILLLSFFMTEILWAQDCADCSQKSLPIPLQKTIEENLSITSKLDKDNPMKVVCIGKWACSAELVKGQMLGHLKNYEEKKRENNEAFKSDLEKLNLANKELDEKIEQIKANLKANTKPKFCENIVTHELPTEECGLSRVEKDLMAFYTVGGFSCLNSYLRRNSDKNPDVESIVQILNDGLSKFPNYQGFVRRAISFTDDDVRKLHVAGATVTYHGFTSTSTNSSFEGDDIFYIFSKTGKPIMGVSSYSYEDEVLFKSGTQFKVLSVEKENNKNYYIMKEVTPGDKASDEKEDKLILEKLKSTHLPTAVWGSGVDSYTCPKESSDKVPTVIQQQKMPKFK